MTKWNQSLQEQFSIVAVDDDIIIGFGDINETGYLDRFLIIFGVKKESVNHRPDGIELHNAAFVGFDHKGVPDSLSSVLLPIQ